jgi:hypothetical protein
MTWLQLGIGHTFAAFEHHRLGVVEQELLGQPAEVLEGENKTIKQLVHNHAAAEIDEHGPRPAQHHAQTVEPLAARKSPEVALVHLRLFTRRGLETYGQFLQALPLGL